MSYVSSLSLSLPIQRSSMQTQSSLAQVVQEESNGGTVADIGMTLGAHTGTALSLQSEMDRLTSYKNTNAIATARLSSTSNALTTILSSAQSMVETLTEATGVGGTTTLQNTSQDALQSLIGQMNTSTGGEFIFAGIKSDQQPISSTAAATAQTSANTAFQSYLSSIPTTAANLTGDQMQTFLDTTFSDQFSDANWSGASGTWSNASSTTIQTNVSPSQSLNTSISANEGAFRQITQAYTMVSAFVGQDLSSGAQAAVLSSATKLVGAGINGLTNLSSASGVAQSTLSTATTDISSQLQVLTSNVNSLESIDPTILATKATQLQTQLTASFELTSKISQLSLVNYLTS